MTAPPAADTNSASVAMPRDWRALAPGLAVALGVAGFLRCWQLQESLWLDELHTAWVASGDWSELVARAQLGNQTPVYFVLNWVSTRLWGTSEWSIRLPSLVAGMALVFSAHWYTWSWTRSATVAGLVALLVAIDRNCIFYAQEARPYAWVQLVALCHLGLAWQCFERGWSGLRLPFVLSGILLYWLHYTTALFLAAEFAALVTLFVLAGDLRKRLPILFLDFLVIGLATLPSLTHVLAIAAHRGDWSQFVKQSRLGASLQWLSSTEYLLIPTILYLLARFQGRREAAPHFWQRFSFLLAVLCLSVGIAFVSTEIDLARINFGRYFVAVAVLPMLLGGLLLGRIRADGIRTACCLGTLLIAGYQSGLVQQWNQDRRFLSDRNHDWRAAVEAVNQEPESLHQPLFVRGGFLEANRLRADAPEILTSYCLAPVNSIYVVESQRREVVPLTNQREAVFTAEHADLIRSRDGGFVLVNGGTKTRDALLDELRQKLADAGAEPQIERRRFGSLELWKVRW